MSRYLLPCECGQKLAVTAAQAGERLQCVCGRQLEVPTLRGLESLERQVEPAAVPELAPWGWRQGVAFLGASIFVLASIGLVVLQLLKPESLEQALVDARSERLDFTALPPAAAWLHWHRVEIGLDRPLTVPEGDAVRTAIFTLKTWSQWRLMTGIAAGIGMAMVVICFPLGRMAVNRTPRRTTLKKGTGASRSG